MTEAEHEYISFIDVRGVLRTERVDDIGERAPLERHIRLLREISRTVDRLTLPWWRRWLRWFR